MPPIQPYNATHSPTGPSHHQFSCLRPIPYHRPDASMLLPTNRVAPQPSRPPALHSFINISLCFPSSHTTITHAYVSNPIRHPPMVAPQPPLPAHYPKLRMRSTFNKFPGLIFAAVGITVSTAVETVVEITVGSQ
mmetsp:Transcript_30694/g.42023  ORF Transcript_30694/g.42023 Transcript_30694/m.42023 type:complete len:135 (-) Transcript_30694:242-646(-)